jgi:hypothetical protein
MPASGKQRQKTEERRQEAWRRHVAGQDQWTIAAALGCTQSAVSRLIQQAAEANPVVGLSYEQRAALSEARWNQGHDELMAELNRQRQEGRVTRRVTKRSDGTEVVEVERVEGPDPSLLRALSNHIDRRNRQLLNQAPVAEAGQTMNISVVQDFLGQSDVKGKLSADAWNDQSSQPAIEASATDVHTDTQEL